MKIFEVLNKNAFGEEVFSGIIPELKYVPTEFLTPGEDLKSQWATIRHVMKADNKTAEEWATWWMKGLGNYPAKVEWWGYKGWDLVVTDGHHRYIAAQILHKPLQVEVTAHNVKPDWIRQFIENNIEELKKYKKKRAINTIS